MKKKIIISGLLVASIIAVMLLSTAAAFNDSYITISGKGRIWQFAPDEDEGEVTDVSAYYILNDDTSQTENPITISRKIITDNVITLVFKTSDLPNLDADTFASGVHVTANTVYTIAGPGFAWGRTR
jgi:hypothetical protein